MSDCEIRECSGRRRREEPGLARRIGLAVEILALYLAAPLIVYVMVFDWRLPLFAILAGVAVAFIVFLTLERDFSWRALLWSPLPRSELVNILSIFTIAGPALALFAYWESPSSFLYFPRALPQIYLLVMLLYPLISVTTQEVIYRVFFYHRYRNFLAGRRWAGIMINAAFFAFAHIIFQNWPAIVISFAGGLLFAWRYERSRLFWPLFVEHALYGNLIFTVGLGRYFFTGVSNLSL